jgi:eukaryotic-like serine/threonine-protein kinase
LPGMVMGTVGYMSPEQVRGEPCDTRSDIFSFGVVLYEMLTGKRAFKRETSAETMTAILREEPQALNDTGWQGPPEIQRILARCLEKNVTRRFQSACDLAEPRPEQHPERPPEHRPPRKYRSPSQGWRGSRGS